MTLPDLDGALWALGRGTGVVALLMFTTTLVLGIVSRSGRPVADSVASAWPSCTAPQPSPASG